MIVFAILFAIMIIGLKIIDACLHEEVSEGMKKEIEKDEYLRS